MPLTNPDDALLPPAVPPYEPDVAKLHSHLGQLTVYNLQLVTEMQRRAEETNRIHDELVATRAERDAAQAQVDYLGQQQINTAGGV